MRHGPGHTCGATPPPIIDRQRSCLKTKGHEGAHRTMDGHEWIAPKPGDRLDWTQFRSGFGEPASSTIVKVTPTGRLRDDEGRLWRPELDRGEIVYRSGGGFVRRLGYVSGKKAKVVPA